MSALYLTDSNWEEEVLKSELPVFVDFWSSWCPPCKMVEPIVDKIAKEYKDKVKVGKINVDQNRGVINKYTIKGVPTFIVFKEGQEQHRLVAAQTENNLKDLIERVL